MQRRSENEWRMPAHMTQDGIMLEPHQQHPCSGREAAATAKQFTSFFEEIVIEKEAQNSLIIATTTNMMVIQSRCCDVSIRSKTQCRQWKYNKCACTFHLELCNGTDSL
jgi:hypothetical protein